MGAVGEMGDTAFRSSRCAPSAWEESMRRWISVLVSITAALAGCGGDDEPIGDGAGLTDALADAQAGDTVTVGACTVSGAFEVPAGVTLSGQGRGTSILQGPAGKAAVTLHPGGSATSLTNLSI